MKLSKEEKKAIKNEFKRKCKENKKYTKDNTLMRPKFVFKDKKKYYIKPIPENVAIQTLNAWKIVAVEDKRYDLVKDISLTINNGEFVMIFGESGSGKTSLLSLLSGLERPSEGEVNIMGYYTPGMSIYDLTEFRKEFIGYVFQQYGLLKDISIMDNIMISSNKWNLSYAYEIVDKLNLRQHLNTKITDLSGGQQQRVSIARAISKKPKILFADEPTGAVDAETAKAILSIFKDLNQNFGVTIIMVSHNPNLTNLASRIIRITDGRISEDYENKNIMSVDEINFE